ncbi:unnamed protein product [Prunus brigantina]
MQPGSAMNTLAAQTLMIVPPSVLSRVASENPTSGTRCTSNPWNTYAELMKQAAVHAKAEYFNSKRSPATPARNPFANPPPTSAPTPAPTQHSTPAPSTQDAQHPKRKDSYQHTFNNNKRGRHGNHH